MGIPQEIVGTIPGWITAGGITAMLGVVLKYRLGWRKLSLEGQRQRDADEADIRDHYAEEVRQLRAKLDKQSEQFRKDMLDLEERYRKLLDDSEKRHDDCQKDRDVLRKRVNDLEDELRGLIRLIAQNSANKVLQLGDDMPNDITAAAERVETILRERGRQ